ncbi:MAG: FAD-dependent oxidoreductase [Streptomycetaceae bacterium]|nr:FAD-dependent oxidoreductase [Streptomycetaceae bacterium]NUS56280.1 FAD-dependent oxidoreductase [Streptomycetaceae bacterium]
MSTHEKHLPHSAALPAEPEPRPVEPSRDQAAPPSRRTFVTGALGAGALGAGVLAAGLTAGAAPAFGASLVSSSPGKRVAVLGGGMAGLTAAHELAERGFQVTVYERKSLGGKARSIPVPGTAAGGRRDLPGEHGFRFFPGFYRNVPDSMRRIPFPGNANGVWDNLVSAPQAIFAQAGRPDMHLTLPNGIENITPEALRDALIAAASVASQVPLWEVAFWAEKMVVFLTSGDLRRRKQWEYMPYSEYLQADKMSAGYRNILIKSFTSTLVAAKETVASTRTITMMVEIFLWTMLGRGNDGAPDRVLNGPTSEVWVEPWHQLLTSLGVTFNVGWTVTGLDYAGGKITGARVTDPLGNAGVVDADYYVLAVPVERAVPLMSPAMIAADPALGRLRRLQTDWMNGLMLYLKQKTPITHGHMAFMDSPWAVTGLTQGQFWRGDFPSTYGDGTVRDVLSLDLSDWDAPGLLYGVSARKCTPRQIVDEVLAQVRANLDNGATILPDSLIHSWFLDPGITGSGTPAVANDEPLLVNTIGSWDDRPDAVTRIPNLFLGGDYVRVSVNLATMEGANESGRRAANGVLQASGSSATPAGIFELYQEPALQGFRDADDWRYRLGLPNAFDVIKPYWP